MAEVANAGEDDFLLIVSMKSLPEVHSIVLSAAIIFFLR